MKTLSHADEIRKARVIEYFENLNLDIEAEYARCKIIEPQNAEQILRKDLDWLKSRLYFLWQIIDIEDVKSNAAEWVPGSDEAWHMSHIALSQHPHDLELTDILVFGNKYKVDDIYDTIRYTEGAERYGFQLLEQLEGVQEREQKVTPARKTLEQDIANIELNSMAEYFESQFEHGVEEYRFGVGSVPELAGMLAHLLTTGFMHYEAGMRPDTPTGKQCAETWRKLVAEMQRVDGQIREHHSDYIESRVRQIRNS